MDAPLARCPLCLAPTPATGEATPGRVEFCAPCVDTLGALERRAATQRDAHALRAADPDAWRREALARFAEVA